MDIQNTSNQETARMSGARNCLLQSSRESRFLKAALHYAARGFAVFPLRPGTKEPFGGSRGYKDATTDEEQIRHWWTRDPAANIGLATGSDSGIVVIDVDVRDKGSGVESLKAFQDRNSLIIETLTQTTPSGGKHLLFRYPPLPPNTTIKSRSGILSYVDVKADGGYIVVSPSKVNGKEYRWDSQDLSPELLADLPSNLLELCPTLTPDQLSEEREQSSVDTSPLAMNQVNSIYTRFTNKRSSISIEEQEEIFDTLDLKNSPFVGLIKDRHPTRLRQKFRSPLPGHQDRNPSAWLYQHDDGKLMFRVESDPFGCFDYDAVTLMMAQAYGQPKPKGSYSAEYPMWRCRLLIELGILPRVEITDLPPCPDDIAEVGRRVYEGFKLMMQCRRVTTEWKDDAAIFTIRFASAWCGVSFYFARKWNVELAKRGIIGMVGETETRMGATKLWLPGDHRKTGGVATDGKTGKQACGRAKPMAREKSMQVQEAMKALSQSLDTSAWQEYGARRQRESVTNFIEAAAGVSKDYIHTHHEKDVADFLQAFANKGKKKRYRKNRK